MRASRMERRVSLWLYDHYVFGMRYGEVVDMDDVRTGRREEMQGSSAEGAYILNSPMKYHLWIKGRELMGLSGQSQWLAACLYVASSDL